MTLRHLSLEQINETHLRGLIAGRASESREVDYKRHSYGSADKDHGEYLADVSSFANTIGGDIIIGMTEKAGAPHELSPITIDVDAEILRLEQLARAGLQPRISGLAIQAIPIEAGGAVLIIRIPRSYNPPHRVVRNGAGQQRFWARSSAGKYEPNVDELRSLFSQAPQIADKMRDFRADRCAKIVAGDTPVPLDDAHVLVLHLVPFSAFDTRLSLPLDPSERLQDRFSPIRTSYTQDYRINVDGLLTLTNVKENTRQRRAYVQVYHNGIVESVASSISPPSRDSGQSLRLTMMWTEAAIVQHSHKYLRGLLAIGCVPPFALLVSLLGVKDARYSFMMGNGVFEDEAGVLDRDQFHFSEVILNSVPAGVYDYAKLVRPLLDQIANAAGRAKTPSFDDTGAFRLSVDR